MRKPKKKQFNYAVGHYWEGESGSVGTYAYGNDIFFGDMDQAQNFLAYVKEQEKKADKRDWKIFQLIEVPV